MESQQLGDNEQSAQGRKNKHIWTGPEDALLVHKLVDMCVSGKFKADNGFKLGTLKEIERHLAKEINGCEIRAHPHIESRLKYFKNKYNALNEMLDRASGFAWDEDKKMIICEKALYDSWVKGHSQAANLWMQPFPHFDNLAIVFGKDRANGKASFTPTELADDASQNANHYEGFDKMSLDDASVTQPQRNTTTSGESSYKRRRKINEPGFVEAIEALKVSATAISEMCRNDSNIHMNKVFDEVVNILGDNDVHNCMRVARIIMRDPVDTTMFCHMSAEMKKDYVTSL